MNRNQPPIIDMTPDGQFAAPPANPFQPTWPVKIAAIGLIVAVTTTMLAIAAIFLWLALWLIPLAFIAWAALRLQLWRLGRAQRGVRRF
jgi:hypothetical protein